jgi:hypothetical protein
MNREIVLSIRTVTIHYPLSTFNYPLFTDIEFLDKRAIFIEILLRQIIEQTAALTNHLQQPAAAVMIFGILLEMRCERIDVFGEDGDLDFRAPRVIRRFAEFRSKLLLLFLGYWHVCVIALMMMLPVPRAIVATGSQVE